jgi:hypothetical protein
MLNWLKSKLTRRRIDPSSDIERDGFALTTEVMPTPEALLDDGLLAVPKTTDRFIVDDGVPTPLIGSLADRRRRTADW